MSHFPESSSRSAGPRRTALFAALLALGQMLPSDAAQAAGERRPIIFVPGTMATAFNGNTGPHNPDVSRVWVDLNYDTFWDLIDDDEVEAYFKLSHGSNSTATNPNMIRGGGRSVSYVGSAASGYFNGLIDDDLPGTSMHVDLRNAITAHDYVLNQTLFALRYDWVQEWGDSQACARLDALVNEALQKSGADRAFLVGHSQGTQVIDYCLTFHTPALRARTAGVVHFAPPTHGGEAHNMYANLAADGLGNSQSFKWYAKIGADASRRIMRSAPALYMLRPDWVFEAELEKAFPWIIGSYGEFRDDYVCTIYCSFTPGAIPQYQRVARTQLVPSGPDLPPSWRENEFTAQLHDAVLASWSKSQKQLMNGLSQRYAAPQLVFRGSGISTPVQYSVHFNTYDVVRPEWPMPTRNSSMVYAPGDGTVPALSSIGSRTTGPQTVYSYAGNLSSTSGCDDRDHLDMFYGACAGEKVGRMMTWIGSVGRFEGASSAGAKQAPDDALGLEDAGVDAAPQATAWKNLSLFAPLPASARDSKTTGRLLATLTLPDAEGELVVGVGDDGEIAFVTDAEGRELDPLSTRARRVFVERVPSTEAGKMLAHIALQVPLAGKSALANQGATIVFARDADRVVAIEERVDAASGARSKAAPELFGRDATVADKRLDGLRFAVGADGGLSRF